MSEQYFQKQEIKSWSLVDFDSWSVQNFNHCQMASTHKKFYSYLNSILLDENASEEEISAARGLIKAKKLLLTQFIARKIHEGFKDDEGADSREKTYEERERELSLRALELSNMEKELELKALEN
ncbi:hypothetical protein RhiirA4_424917 [Rhizophagus irregularis]|uniref:Uncharacterized protein n=1 Tax=Rhizophagus irregularis TaxID=588596 RepID=A0A2I1GZB8_9GLOM|nr:hypothetical protein RhiirA4_424917 [Rhizophagus irregularis]